MIENVSTQLTVFHCFAHCLLPGRAFASLYVLLFLEKEAEIGGRVKDYRIRSFLSIRHAHGDLCKRLGIDSSTDLDDRYSNLFLNAYINRRAHTEYLNMIL